MSLNILCKLTEKAKIYQPKENLMILFQNVVKTGEVQEAKLYDDRDSLFILKAFSRRGSRDVVGGVKHEGELVLLKRISDGELFVFDGFEGIKIVNRDANGGVATENGKILTTNEFSVNRGIECAVTDIGHYFPRYDRTSNVLNYPEATEGDEHTGRYHDDNLEKTKAHLFVMVAMLKDDEDRAICVIESRVDGEIYLINGEGLSMETTDLSIENNEESQMDVSSNNHTDSYFVKPSSKEDSDVYFVKEDVIEKNGKRYKLVEIKLM